MVFFCDASNKGLGGYLHEPVMLGGLPIHHWCFCQLPVGMTMTFTKGRGPELERQAFMNGRQVGSGYTESAALLYMLSVFLPRWAALNPIREPGIGIWCHSDSDVLVSMWRSKKAGVTLLPYLRALARLSALYNITLIVVHIPGSTNTIADAVSRQNWRKFRRLLPSAASHPTLPLCESQIFF